MNPQTPISETGWIRTATAAEKCAAMPYLKTQCRNPRKPALYCAGQGAEPSAFVAGILPDARAPFDGDCFQIELIPLAEQNEETEALLNAALTHLVHELSADHLTTPLQDDDTPEVSFLRSCGFNIVATSHRLANAFEDARNRIADLNRLIDVWTRRQAIEIVPYTQADQDQVLKLHREILDEIPQGHLAMNQEISTDYSYKHSYVAVKDDTCLGLMVNGIRGTETVVETLLVVPEMTGTPLAAALVAKFINHPDTEDLRVAHFVVSSRNTQALGFVESLGARRTSERVRLAKPSR